MRSNSTKRNSKAALQGRWSIPDETHVTVLQELQALVAQLAQPSSSGSSLYVLQRPGPSSFVVGQDPGGDKFKVALGNQPTCSCRRARHFRNRMTATAAAAATVHMSKSGAACRTGKLAVPAALEHITFLQAPTLHSSQLTCSRLLQGLHVSGLASTLVVCMFKALQ